MVRGSWYGDKFPCSSIESINPHTSYPLTTSYPLPLTSYLLPLTSYLLLPFPRFKVTIDFLDLWLDLKQRCS
jgi:hypothetical protein